MTYSQSDLQEIIQTEIEETLKTLEVSPAHLYDPIRYIMEDGGKRLRPALVLMACNMFTNDITKAIPAALGLEVFHNFTLVHDDLMDNAPLRRKRETVHTKWNPNIAILSGDAMSILSYKLICQSDASILKQLLQTFSQTTMEVCEGQQMDMDFETRNDVTVEEYLEMIKLKTSGLIAACTKIGSICGGANETDSSILYDYGLNLGLAFQLQDDLLDVYGDQKTFGKSIGGDILSNKKTFLLLNALKQANEEQSQQLHYWLNATEYQTEEKIASVIKIFNELEIKELTESKIMEYHKLSLDQMDKVRVSSERKNNLMEVAEKLLSRQN